MAGRGLLVCTPRTRTRAPIEQALIEISIGETKVEEAAGTRVVLRVSLMEAASQRTGL